MLGAPREGEPQDWQARSSLWHRQCGRGIYAGDHVSESARGLSPASPDRLRAPGRCPLSGRQFCYYKHPCVPHKKDKKWRTPQRVSTS
jgi:hypothetical protein